MNSNPKNEIFFRSGIFALNTLGAHHQALADAFSGRTPMDDEIGQRLHVSRHTVKTQAISVYRKFGVSSRSEAIQCAHDVGLLGH